MKFIDIHTHIFPEKIAASTLQKLEKVIGVTPSTNGLKEGLIAACDAAGIETAVIQPVVTRPEQFDSIIRFASQFQEGRLISWGGIHPADENYKEHLRTINSMGFKGLKVHPDYQDVMFNDIRMKRLISYANELGLFVITHAGFDPISKDLVHCTPKIVHEVLRDVRPDKLILAHMGGNDFSEEVEELLIGEDVYLDTSYVLRLLPKDRLIYALTHHHPDKILFGTDSPWSCQKSDTEYFRSLEIDQELKEKIAWKNAENILK